METFIYETLNNASRNQENNKINSLGPLSKALATIVAGAECRRPVDNQSLPKYKYSEGEWLTLYRGLKLTPDEI